LFWDFQKEYNEAIDIGKMFENFGKILKFQIESEFVTIRVPAAIPPAKSANRMQSSTGCNTVGRS
jgi:hypothetical protein